jgi:diguanylate cyclase (GGDEF)-like protein/PAS domain S-box-containing protein
MNWQNTPYLLPLVASALVSSALGYYALKRRGFPAAYSFALLLGIQAVWAGLLIVEISNMDPIPFIFTLLGLTIMLGFIGFRLFEVTPIPRSNMFKSMCDGLIVLNKQGKVIDINPAAQKILALQGRPLLNRSAEQVLRPWPDLVQLCCQEMIQKIEFTRDNGQEKYTFDVRRTPLTGWRGVHVGHLLIFHDITELKRVEADLLLLSLTDHLTGLANRRKLLEIMQAEISQAVRYQLPLSAIMLDLDNLKDINDTFGHPAGDEALRMVARVLTLSCRQADLAARLGGDEFILLLPHTPIAGAQQLSQTLKEAISSLKISQGASIGVSMGYAAFDPMQDHRGEDLVHRADQALYLAKQSSKIRKAAYSN